jgi:hypothetical protein
MTPEQKQLWAEKFHKLLATHNDGHDSLFARLVMGDDSWFHYHTPGKIP